MYGSAWSKDGKRIDPMSVYKEPEQEPECPHGADAECKECYDQTALDLCSVCGWRTMVPGDACLNCERVKPEQEPCAMRYDFDGYGYRYIDSGSGSNWQTRHKDAEPLYTAPAPQPAQPVAWMCPDDPDRRTAFSWPGTDRHSDFTVPLYTSAPTPRKPEPKVWCACGDSIEPDSGAKCGNCVAGDSAEPEQEPVAWVELTDEEQLELARDSMGKSRHWLVAQVEAKLKEKNT